MNDTIEIDDELLSSFVDDVIDALIGFEEATVALRTIEYDEALRDLFRTAHNIKGASMCIGLRPFAEFIHSVEDVFQSIINGHVERNERLISVLLKVHSCLNAWARELLGNPVYEPPLEAIFIDLRSLGVRITPSPFSKLRSGLGAHDPGVAQEEEDLTALFKTHRRIYEEDRARQRASASTPSGVPVSARYSSSLREPKSKAAPLSRLKSKHGGRVTRPHETLRISAEKLDELIQSISELAIYQEILYGAQRDQGERPHLENLEGHNSKGLFSKSANRAIQLSHKLVKEIHARALDLRMQPVSGLMQKLERNAAELATMQGKQVNIILEGGDVQLDKSVIERISDPLIHVIRNAIDHGIEAPARRTALGKPAEATIKISAVQDGAGVALVVSDDGRGMDDKVIFAAAVRQGIVRPEERLTSDQIRKLIFIQGISTAPKLTEISGRGVGMDIVMATVQSLRGKIDLESTLGKGTSISITLPTSLSIVEALVVTVQEARYAVPMHELTEIIDLGSYPIESTGQGGVMISLRGEVVPVETLANYMPMQGGMHVDDPIMRARSGRACPALIVREGAQSIAFAIDQVISQQQVVARPLSDQLDGLQGYSGCAILGDGEPGVILSLPDLARAYFASLNSRGGDIS